MFKRPRILWLVIELRLLCLSKSSQSSHQESLEAWLPVMNFRGWSVGQTLTTLLHPLTFFTLEPLPLFVTQSFSLRLVWEFSVQFSSVTQSCLTLWQAHGLQHSRPPCPSPTIGVHSNSCPLSRWCHPTISSSVVPFFSHLQSFPASRSFPMSQLFTSGGQSIGVSASASVLPMNIQD